MIRYDIETDGRVVWVNSRSGMCIGRFSKVGVDIHADSKDQMAGAHCLHCVHDKPLPEMWEEFVSGMKTHYGIDIDASYRPSFVIEESGIHGLENN